jgi:hypothetical protein
VVLLATLLVLGLAFARDPFATRDEGDAAASRDAGRDAATAALPPGNEVHGTEWEWTGGVEAATGRAYAVSDPSAFRLRIDSDGTAAVHAGCAWVAGRYDATLALLTLDRTLGDPASCPSVVGGGRFLERLRISGGFHIDATGVLVARLAGGGTLEFRPVSPTASGTTAQE